MRTRMYGGVRGRKTKVGGKPTFVFLLLYQLAPNTNYLFILAVPEVHGIVTFMSLATIPRRTSN